LSLLFGFWFTSILFNSFFCTFFLYPPPCFFCSLRASAPARIPPGLTARFFSLIEMCASPIYETVGCLSFFPFFDGPFLKLLSLGLEDFFFLFFLPPSVPNWAGALASYLIDPVPFPLFSCTLIFPLPPDLSIFPVENTFFRYR